MNNTENKVYAIITDRIVKALEAGTIPWKKPWMSKNGQYAVSRSSGKPYGMLNQMLLPDGGEWATYKQWETDGGQVKKGEKASIIMMYFESTRKTDADKDDDDDAQKKFYSRYVSVFHINQVDGVTPKYTKPVEEPTETIDRIPEADAVLQAYLKREHIAINHSGDKAFYRPSSDSITLPPVDSFFTSAGYYETAYHEAIHSTGHKKRLGRITDVAAFGGQTYGREELVAEVGAAFSLARLGIEDADAQRNNEAYCQSWLKAIKGDSSLIIKAAAQAEKAVKLIFA